jgi:hypothetical protein
MYNKSIIHRLNNGFYQTKIPAPAVPIKPIRPLTNNARDLATYCKDVEIYEQQLAEYNILLQEHLFDQQRLMETLKEHQQWHTSTGRINYDPYRPGLKTKNTWWCVIDTDPGIVEYYRSVVNRVLINPLQLKDCGLVQPAWGSHVSVIRGEKPRENKMHLWKKYHNQTVEFRYSFNVRFSGDTTASDKEGVYWFVEVDCPAATAIRDEFEIPSDWLFHLTIARTRN